MQQTPHQPIKLAGVDQVRALLATTTDGIKRATLMRTLDLTESQVDNAIHSLCRAGEAERVGYGIIKPTLKLKTVVVTHTVTEPQQAPKPTPTKAVAKESNDIDFAIHADGRLSIIDGSQTFTLRPEETRRLGVFLGLFDCDLITERLSETSTTASV